MSNDSLSDAILSAGKSITGDWKKAKKRQDRVSQSSLTKLRQWRLRPTSFKDAAFTVMEDAYRKASSNGRYYANARQLMYENHHPYGNMSALVNATQPGQGAS